MGSAFFIGRVEVAAHRSGTKRVMLPARNRKDFDEIL